MFPLSIIVTFHGKMYIDAFLFNGLKGLLVICLPLKRLRKSLEALECPLKFSLWPFTALEKSLKVLVKTVQISLQWR